MNPDEYSLYQYLHYWQNHEKVLTRRKELYRKSLEYRRQYNNEYKRKWRIRNPERTAAQYFVNNIYRDLRQLEAE